MNKWWRLWNFGEGKNIEIFAVYDDTTEQLTIGLFNRKSKHIYHWRFSLILKFDSVKLIFTAHFAVYHGGHLNFTNFMLKSHLRILFWLCAGEYWQHLYDWISSHVTIKFVLVNYPINFHFCAVPNMATISQFFADTLLTTWTLIYIVAELK